MITFDRATKRFADGTIGVENLSLEVAAGEVVVLVGPSGCGKTTSMRLVNRMETPTSGRVLIDGDDVAELAPAHLRRRIGYVIQQTGLFPHYTVERNIATVPDLLGWDRDRIGGRVTELVELVGLPHDIIGRYPHQLSGGQRQRVGVARALAVDPPMMLMDEPFGAVDPIVRLRLQDEFLRLQSEVHKTIIFVTHDIDEALKMGDRIAILSQGGHLEQFGTPLELLTDPSNEFVAEFLGEERGLKRLGLIPVSEITAEPGPVVRVDDDRRRAEDVARAYLTNWVVVVDHADRLQGWLSLVELGDGRIGEQPVRSFALRVEAHETLRSALNGMVTNGTGVAVRVSAGERYEGILTQELIAKEIG